MTPHLDLDTIEEAAKAATPGPWEAADYFDAGEYRHGRVFMRGHENPMTNTRDCPLTLADAHFIATANPETVLALVAEVRRLREALEAVRGYPVCGDDCAHSMAVIAGRALSRPDSGKGGER